MDISEIYSRLVERNQLHSKTDNDLFSFDENKGLEIVLNNKAVFQNKVNEASRQLRDKNYEMAARWAFEAAKFAVLNHPGCFTFPELELILHECGKNLPGITLTLKLPEKKEKRRVFHVMSEGYSIGGHTRLVKNWIERDKESEHYLLNTWQIKTTPKWLIDAVGKSGGVCIPLETVSSSYVALAAVLREITRKYADIVVCHIHMNDPIPIMALSENDGPPVVFLNHADHLFWMGSSIADVVFDIRPTGQKLTLSRRNVKNSSLLPIPLSNPQNTISKEQARKELGLPLDADVIISIATTGKYDSFSRYDFLDFLKEVLQRNENAVAILVGPPDYGKFRQAYIDTNGRIRAVGQQNEIERYYCCADIYLDSYMFCSLTSALDAGLRGLPIVSLKNYNYEVLSCDDISFEGLNNQFTKMDEYIEYIDKLVKDKEFRNSEGKILSDRIRANHTDSWKAHLDRGYSMVENTRHVVSVDDFNDGLEVEDLFLALYLRQNNPR